MAMRLVANSLEEVSVQTEAGLARMEKASVAKTWVGSEEVVLAAKSSEEALAMTEAVKSS